MAEDCTSFYYVQSGDGCYNIAANNRIALDELYTWNPALNGDCLGLWPNYYIWSGLVLQQQQQPQRRRRRRRRRRRQRRQGQSKHQHPPKRGW
ncbi:hypothetical protein BDW66DRAFT_144586 [Aspergillus desertorum]